MSTTAAPQRKALRVRQRLGKYRIQSKLGNGSFAVVYSAMDTIEGRRVALKIPHEDLVGEATIRDFRHEIRTVAKLDHPNILQLKDASFIDDKLVIALPLGIQTLTERMQKRASTMQIVGWFEQILDAVAFAHRHKIIHCDIKPDNIILFDDGEVRLADFGIARIAKKTVKGSGSGTLGYMSTEQAMGKPSFRSDVFATGLIGYRMLTGRLPEYPFDWPPPGYTKLRGKVHPKMIALLKRALDPDSRRRYRDAEKMHDAWGLIRTTIKRHLQRRGKGRK